jgi:hypothetical protein
LIFFFSHAPGDKIALLTSQPAKDRGRFYSGHIHRDLFSRAGRKQLETTRPGIVHDVARDPFAVRRKRICGSVAQA